MPAYFVFHNRVIDPAKFQEYIPKALDTLAPFDPELLVLDESSEVVEGQSELPRTVVIGFESREKALAWYRSPEYRAIHHLRLEATEGYAVLVDGFTAPDD